MRPGPGWAGYCWLYSGSQPHPCRNLPLNCQGQVFRRLEAATPGQEDIALAKESQCREDLRVKSKGLVAVAGGTILAVHLRLPGFIVDDCEDIIAWEGEIGSATFPVTVPADAKLGAHIGQATIYVYGLQIAKMHFVVELGRDETRSEPVCTKEQRLRTAFASYASRDRDEALARIQGIQKAIPNLDIFLDVASLRSGERWAERLFIEVTGRDVFYLFWSLHAKNSEWVEKEWRAALEVRGIEYIDPVPLVPPEQAPPQGHRI